MSLYDQLMLLFVQLSAISMATERSVEMIKPLVRRVDPEVGSIGWKFISWVLGELIYVSTMDSTPLSIFGNTPFSIVLVGLCVSAGSGFWHDLLGFTSSLKTK